MMQWRYFTAAVAILCLSSACQRQPQPPATPQATDTAPAKPAVPLAEPPYNRETLLLATLRAASNAALGRPDVDWQRTLDGKPFELKLRFGCGEGNGDAQAQGWTFDAKRRVLSLRVRPGITGSDAMIDALGLEGYEAAEGFWIRRPWLLAAACPAPPTPRPAAAGPSPIAQASAAPNAHASAAPAAEPSPTPIIPRIGLAQFFTKTDARTIRHGKRAYEATKILPDGTSPSMEGYNLVITGRLRSLNDGSVIACVNRGTDAPPDCIISAQVDTVAIQRPDSGEAIATWSKG